MKRADKCDKPDLKAGLKFARSGVSDTRVNDYGRESYCTPASKAKLMKQIRDEGLPEHFSASAHARGRHRTIAPLLYDVEFDLADGGTVFVPFQRPAEFLQRAVATCAPFAALFAEAVAKSEHNVLRVLLYADEIEPADPLKKGDRKLLATYWSFMEFPAEALANEDVWFTLSLIRTSVADTFLDGYCQVMCKTLDALFVSESSFNGGVTFELLFQGTKPVFARSGVLVSDEKAIKQLTGVKGSSGRKLCFLCMNVKAWRFFKPDPAGLCVPSTCLDKAKLMLHTDASLRESYRKVLRARDTMGPNPFIEYERESGLTAMVKYHPLLRDDFGAVSSVMWDLMHVYFSEGIMENECVEFMNRLSKTGTGLGCGALDACLQEWTWPKCYASGAGVCKKGRVDATASIYLSAAPVIGKWVETVVVGAGVLTLECDSMLHLCRTVSMLQLALRGLCEADDLENAIITHLAKQQIAYGTTVWKAKNKHAMHLADQYRKHGRLYMCATLERKHKVPKRFAGPRVNTTSFERGMLEEISDQQLWDLKQPILASALAQPREATPKMRSALTDMMLISEDAVVHTSPIAKVEGRSVHMRDVVWMRDGSAAEVWFFCGIEDAIYACVSRWPTVRVLNATSIIVSTRDSPYIVPLDSIRESVIYRRDVPLKTATLLLPFGA